MKTMLLALLPLLATASAQEPPAPPPGDSLELASHATELDPEKLEGLLHKLYRGTHELARTEVIHDRILLAGSPQAVEATLGRLRAIERSLARDAEAAPPVTQMEYRPRFLRLKAAYELLEPFERAVEWRGATMTNLSAVEGHGILLLRDTPERLVELRQVLERLDRPPLQIRLRLQLFVPASEPAEGGASEVALTIASLVDQPGLRRIGSALLSTSICAEPQLCARLGSWNDLDYELRIVPAALDVETGSLTTRSCALVALGDDFEQLVFSTAAVLDGSETTVLGATGVSPVFLAVDLERIP